MIPLADSLTAGSILSLYSSHVPSCANWSSCLMACSSTFDKEAQEHNLEAHNGDLSELCSLFGAEPVDLLSLQNRQDSSGVRGVFCRKDVQKGEVLLRMPLSSCLRDDNPPSWFTSPPTGRTMAQEKYEDPSLSQQQIESDDYSVAVEGWVTRLSASLLDIQLHKESQSAALQTWLCLLPTDLNTILPIHWESEELHAVQSRSLQSAVDSAYFARAGILADLEEAVRRLDSNHAFVHDTATIVERAVDLIQTRSCRCESKEEGDAYTRVLVPIFDMINHSRKHNAEFFREKDSLVVRSITKLKASEEVTINYGGATIPAWKCLFSYGFVPLSEDVYEDDAAEIQLEGGPTVEVGPTELPFELIRYQATKMGISCDDEDFELTAEIGGAIVKILRDEGEKLVDSSAAADLKASVHQDALKALRQSNRQTLLACAGGLEEFIGGD